MSLSLALQKRFENFRLDVDFRIEGKRVGIFGRSGSGKSTLVHLLAGLLEPDGGAIRFGDRILYDYGRRLCLPPDQRRVGVVFQHSHLFPHLSVEGNLLYGFRRIPKIRRRIDPADLCRVLDIAHLLPRSVHHLSGGERQRVALGRTVLADPQLLLMDEPLTGLDEKLKYQIIPYLNQVLTEYDIPLLYVSHSMNEMRLLVEEVLVLDGGRLVDRTTPDNLARQRMKDCPMGYLNFLRLEDPQPRDQLWSYRWGSQRLMLNQEPAAGDNLFTLTARDILLFRRHPESISARNLLRCTVREVFDLGPRVGVELGCGGRQLITQMMPPAVTELDISPGNDLYAAIRADAFRRLY